MLQPGRGPARDGGLRPWRVRASDSLPDQDGDGMRITLLGSGTSHGVPAIACECAVCHSADPRDRRMRPSILIDLGDIETRFPAQQDGAPSPIAAAVRYILVDAGTDLRAQALAFNVRRVDAIFFTHSHADHIMGLDDVRRYNMVQQTTIGCYADQRTLNDLRRTFSYIFEPPPRHGGGVPKLSLFEVGGPFSIGGVEIVPVPVLHGPRPILGYRLGSFAYLTDCNRIPDSSWPLLEGVDTLIIDALRDRPHSTHFSVGEALQAAERIGSSRTYFTHVCHELPHAATCARLPAGVELAYDGLVLDVT
jgi:phosphoribosyl 1,2-cyclic phosphate phosphodiesterase